MAKQANVESNTTKEIAENKSTRMVNLLDEAYDGIDHSRCIVSCLAEGLTVTGGAIRKDVAYDPEALFMVLSLVSSKLDGAYDQIKAINKLWADSRAMTAKEAR